MESNDPLFDDYCAECGPKLEQLIKYVRLLENGQIAAKEALDTLTWANEKLTKKMEDLREKANQSERLNIKTKMKELTNAEQKLVNRSKLV